MAWVKIGRGAGIVCIAALTSLLGAFSACSSFTAADTADGGGDASPNDANASPMDANASPMDANADASTFCSAVDASFCSDFDEPALTTPYRWDSVFGGVQIWSDAGDSPPAALHAATLSDGGLAYLSKTFHDTHGIRVELDFELPALPTSGLVGPVTIQSPDDKSGDSSVTFYVGSAADSAWFQQDDDQSRLSGTALPQSLGPGAWHHIIVVIDTTSSTIDAQVDSTAAWQGHLLSHAFPQSSSSGTTTTFQVSVGAATEYAPPGEHDVLVDNVVVQAQ